MGTELIMWYSLPLAYSWSSSSSPVTNWDSCAVIIRGVVYIRGKRGRGGALIQGNAIQWTLARPFLSQASQIIRTLKRKMGQREGKKRSGRGGEKKVSMQSSDMELFYFAGLATVVIAQCSRKPSWSGFEETRMESNYFAYPNFVHIPIQPLVSNVFGIWECLLQY